MRQWGRSPPRRRTAAPLPAMSAAEITRPQSHARDRNHAHGSFATHARARSSAHREIVVAYMERANGTLADTAVTELSGRRARCRASTDPSPTAAWSL